MDNYLQHVNKLIYVLVGMYCLTLSDLVICYSYNRRRAEFGMLNEPHATIDDAEIASESPTLGESIVIGRLRASGYRVSRDRLRRIMRDLDPLSVVLRWPGIATRRRPYSVPGPNSLWHVGKINCRSHHTQKKS